MYNGKFTIPLTVGLIKETYDICIYKCTSIYLSIIYVYAYSYVYNYILYVFIYIYMRIYVCIYK